MATGNPFTSAQAPAAMQMLAPDIAAEQTKLARQQQMADILRSQALQQDQGTQVINGWAVKKSPLEGLAKIAAALSSRYQQGQVDDKQLALAKAIQQRMGGAFDSMAGGGAPPGAGPAAPSPAAAPPQPGGMPDAAPIQTFPVAPPEGVATPPAAAPATPAPTPAPQMSQVDRIRNQAKAAYMMGNTDLANKLLENISTLTESQRNMAAMGQNPLEMGRLGTAAARKAGIIELQPGTTALDLSNGQERFQPKVGEGISLNNGQASAIPGYAGAAAGIAGANAAAVSGAQAGNEMVTVNVGGRNVTMTKAQAVQMSGGGTLVPAAGTPPIDINHMTPQERQTLMTRAQAQFGLQPSATPGASVQGAPAPAGGIGIAGSTPAEDAQKLADVKLRTEPQLSQKTKEYQDMADYGKALDGHVSESQALLRRVAESREALTKFGAGGGAETRAKLASMAQAFGLPNNMVNKIAGGDLAAAQVFQKFAAQEALGTMQQALASDSGKGAQGNRISMDLFIKNNPNIGTDPNAIEQIFNFLTKEANQSKAQQEAYHAYKNDPKNDPSAFPGYWAGEAIKRGFVTPEIKSGYAKGVPPAVQSVLDKYK